MRKGIYGRRLKRDTNERKALFRTLMREMVLRGQIKTTEAKAKSVKPELEKVVTKALKSKTPEYFLLKKFNKNISDRIITEIAPKFQNRKGGYTRIIKLGRRTKDNADMALLEWVEKVEAVPTKAPKRSDKKADKKQSGKSSLQKPKKVATQKASKKSTQAPKSQAKQTIRRVQKKG